MDLQKINHVSTKIASSLLYRNSFLLTQQNVYNTNSGFNGLSSEIYRNGILQLTKV